MQCQINTRFRQLHNAWTHSSRVALAASLSSSSALACSFSTSTSTSSPVRVRFAPSPTGSLHLGGLRTAAYNYLIAKQSGGTFLLRVEDTDQKRLVDGAVSELSAVLDWAGLQYDEGPERPGQCGPYTQSERLPLYRAHAHQLVEKGDAYPCFCSAERLEELRAQQMKKNLPSMYDRLCTGIPHSDRLNKMKQAEAQGVPYVIRMKIPDGNTTIKDQCRGTVTFPNKQLDDQVLLKSDGFPTYHLAVVVDDHAMNISHVIRGEEWLSSTPKHVILYKMFGWRVPLFAHLPLLLKPDGSKLSKRSEDAAAEYYIRQGFLPEAVLNFVAFLGWNPGTAQEVFTKEELIQAFSLSRVSRSGAIVNQQKMLWFNAQHIRKMVDQQLPKLVQQIKPLLVAAHPSLSASDAYISSVLTVLRDHVSLLPHFVDYSHYFFAEPSYTTPDAIALKAKAWKDEEASVRALRSCLSVLSTIPSSSFSSTTVSQTLKQVMTEEKIGQKQLFTLLRYVLTGIEIGPSVTAIICALGQETVNRRITTFTTPQQ